MNRYSTYLAGPMRGIARFNFPTFDGAREYLREYNRWTVHCPAEHDRQLGFDDTPFDGTEPLDGLEGFDLATSFAWDLQMVCEADSITMLPGWSKSTGAKHELATAEFLGKKVFYYDPEGEYGFRMHSTPLAQDNPTVVFEEAMLAGAWVEPKIDTPLAVVAAAGEIRTTSSTGGAKGVKPERHDLVPVGSMDSVARVYGFGAQKYDDHNWRKGYEWSKSYAAAQRHMKAFWSGIELDDESGEPHLAHAVFHCLALMEWAATHPEFDDRYKAVELSAV